MKHDNATKGVAKCLVDREKTSVITKLNWHFSWKKENKRDLNKCTFYENWKCYQSLHKQGVWKKRIHGSDKSYTAKWTVCLTEAYIKA